MDPFERDLRQVLARRDPGERLTAAVMERVRNQASAEQTVIGAPARRPLFGWRWATAGALAASLAGGVYMQQQRQGRAAERAEAELVEALFLAGSKINYARYRAWAMEGVANNESAR
jgi:hypothetical protein